MFEILRCLIIILSLLPTLSLAADCHPVTPPPPSPPSPPSPPVSGGVYDILSTMNSGDLVQLTNNLDTSIVPGDALEYSTKGYCSATKCTFLGQGHALDDPSIHIEYDIAMDTWSRLPDLPTDIGHSYESVAINGDTIYFKSWNGDVVFKYESGAWSQLPAVPNTYVNNRLGAIEWFPGVGLVLYEPYEGVFIWNGVSWSEPFVNPNYFSSVHCAMSMDTQSNVMMFGGCNNPPAGQELRQMEANGNVSSRTLPVPSIGARMGALLDDHLFASDGNIYKRMLDSWQTVGTHTFIEPNGDLGVFFDLGTGYMIMNYDLNTYLYKK